MFCFRKVVVGPPDRISAQPLTVGLIGGQFIDIIDAYSSLRRTFMRCEIADKSAPQHGIACPYYGHTQLSLYVASMSIEA
jgi:hypothetical protein